MRGFGLTLLAVALAVAPGASAQEASFTWEHEGYRSLVDAAAEAKERGALLLVGLFGGPG